MVEATDAEGLRAKLAAMGPEGRAQWASRAREGAGSSSCGEEWEEAVQLAVDQAARITRSQMQAILSDAFTRYHHHHTPPSTHEADPQTDRQTDR